MFVQAGISPVSHVASGISSVPTRMVARTVSETVSGASFRYHSSQENSSPACQSNFGIRADGIELRSESLTDQYAGFFSAG